MGWGDPKGPRPLASPPAAATGTTGQIEAARAALHAWGIIGNNLAEEAQMACQRIAELTCTTLRNPPPGAYC